MIAPGSFAPDQQLNSISAQPISLGVLLSDINTLSIRLRQRGRGVPGSPAELPGAEYAILEIVHRFGARTVPQIARERSTSRQNIQILVDRLVDGGQVELTSNPAHKRSALVQLTEMGRESLQAGLSCQKQLLAQLTACLSDKEIVDTVNVLRRLHSVLAGESSEEPRARSSTPTVEVDSEPDQVAIEEFPLNLL